MLKVADRGMVVLVGEMAERGGLPERPMAFSGSLGRVSLRAKVVRNVG